MSGAQTIFAGFFVLCAAAIGYSYVGYAVMIWVASRLLGKQPTPPHSATLPTVSLLIAAYNEQAVLRQRLANALASDYPADKLEIVVGSDGSDDATAAIVAEVAAVHPQVRLLAYPHRRGKATVLNDSLPQLRGEVVAFSDANTFTDPAALRQLVRWFADPAVGAVCGRLVLIDSATGNNADGAYWKYETFLKKCEARLGALLGANGAIYALRRRLFVPIPPDTIVDDFVVPLLAKLKHGIGIVYDADAVATEETAPNVAGEFHRRVRIGAGGWQALTFLWPLMDPRRGWSAVAFFSHKLLRWMCPMAMAGMLGANLLLINHPGWAVIFAVQLAFYGAAAAGPLVPGRSRLIQPLRIATMFVSMNLALLLGFGKWLAGTQRSAWQRTARSSETAVAAQATGGVP